MRRVPIVQTSSLTQCERHTEAIENDIMRLITNGSPSIVGGLEIKGIQQAAHKPTY